MTRTECSVFCVGELVWDFLPGGPRLGGAPLNVSVHLARQGLQVALLTAVGRDPLGARALAFLEQEGIQGALTHPLLPTGTVQVELDPAGIPRFSIDDACAWTDLAGALRASLPFQWESVDLSHLSVVVFGGLAMHSPGNRQLLGELLDQCAAKGGRPPLRLCDLNLRPGWRDPEAVRWCADHADILKVNEEERQFLAELEPGTGTDPDRALIHRYCLQALCTTLGPGGLRWAEAAGADRVVPAWQGEGAPPVIDTVGAGDAITAAIALGIHRAEAPAVFLERGSRWAAMICGQPGALPPDRRTGIESG